MLLLATLLEVRLQVNKNIIEAANLPEGEKVYLKKDYFGWRVVEPPTKWYHYIFGSKRNVVFLLFIAVIAIGLYFGILELISAYRDVAANPCNYCTNTIIDNMKINLPKL